MYYVYDYVITVYSNLMYRGSAAMAEWMSTLIVIMYFVFYIRYIEIVSRQSELQLEKLAYEVSAKHAEKEIDKYRQAQDKLAVYRHDMHHHLQYISNCIAGGDTEKAQQYIRSISEQIGSAAVRRYCSCEALDLLLSAYIDRAESLGIRCDVAVQAGSSTSLPETDLCSLFANVFENAINANAALPDGMERYISVAVHTKNGKLCICISNPCAAEVVFENGLPKTGEDGHGFGAKSVQRVVDKSGGVCRFCAENGAFYFTLFHLGDEGGKLVRGQAAVNADGEGISAVRPYGGHYLPALALHGDGMPAYLLRGGLAVIIIIAGDILIPRRLAHMRGDVPLAVGIHRVDIRALIPREERRRAVLADGIRYAHLNARGRLCVRKRRMLLRPPC